MLAVDRRRPVGTFKPRSSPATAAPFAVDGHPQPQAVGFGRVAVAGPSDPLQSHAPHAAPYIFYFLHSEQGSHYPLKLIISVG